MENVYVRIWLYGSSGPSLVLQGVYSSLEAAQFAKGEDGPQRWVPSEYGDRRSWEGKDVEARAGGVNLYRIIETPVED